MAKSIRHPLKELKFSGGRFEQNKGWLDFDILPELQAYRKILIETAKEEWKRNNPGRERLPRGFEENIRLGFHEIREGSCAVPVERLVEVEDDAFDFYAPDELDEAVKIIDSTLIAVREDKPFPERLPAKIIPMFADWGNTLTPAESIILDGQNESGPQFNNTIKDKILNFKKDRYEDRVELVGEVRAAELKAKEGGNFSILIDNGETIPGVFTAEQEADVTEALHEHRQKRLKIIGLGEFEVSGQLRRIVRVEKIEERLHSELPFDSKTTPIWDTIETIGKSIPAEEWEEIPTDLSKNLDHYLYGKPKDGRQ